MAVEYGLEPDRLAQRLARDKDFHDKLRTRLLDQLKAGETAMSKFYPRWRANEIRLQAYITLPDYEKQLKAMSNKGEPPKITSITVPYAFATQATIVTYLLHTFCGRKPMFQIGTYKDETAQSSRVVETVLQYNADSVRLVKHLWQWLNDMELYGVGVLRTAWKDDWAKRTVWQQPGQGMGGTMMAALGLGKFLGGPQRVRESRLVFQGTEVKPVDPFCFFPDPRVPIADVGEKGEFAFWRDWANLNSLKLEAAMPDSGFFGIDLINLRKQVQNEAEGMSARAMLSKGEANPGANRRDHGNTLNPNVQLDQGTVLLVPSDWGLGASDTPEKWIFTLANKDRIIQAEPFDMDHGRHPVAVAEPYTVGYGFGQAGLSDYLGPVQDAMSWFLNSHIHNVRATLNNIFIANPALVEMQDFRGLDAGGVVRLKQSSLGVDVRTAVQQIPVQDVTRGHVDDMTVFMRMGDTLASVNDNLRGVQESGGRKTATEVRTSGESAASRLAAHARLISAQGMVDLTEQMVLNMQQFLDMDFYLNIVGQEGTQAPIHINPQMLAGDFHYPVHDGTLPLDRVALLDVWKEIFLAVAQDPQLRSQYDIIGLFGWIGELSGAQGLERFKLNVAPGGPMEGPDPLGADPLASGNAVPLEAAIADLGAAEQRPGAGVPI